MNMKSPTDTSKKAISRSMLRRRKKTTPLTQDEYDEDIPKFETGIDKVKACRKHRHRKATLKRAFRKTGSKKVWYYGLCHECATQRDGNAEVQKARVRARQQKKTVGSVGK